MLSIFAVVILKVSPLWDLWRIILSHLYLITVWQRFHFVYVSKMLSMPSLDKLQLQQNPRHQSSRVLTNTSIKGENAEQQCFSDCSEPALHRAIHGADAQDCCRSLGVGVKRSSPPSTAEIDQEIHILLYLFIMSINSTWRSLRAGPCLQWCGVTA